MLVSMLMAVVLIVSVRMDLAAQGARVMSVVVVVRIRGRQVAFTVRAGIVIVALDDIVAIVHIFMGMFLCFHVTFS